MQLVDASQLARSDDRQVAADIVRSATGDGFAQDQARVLDLIESHRDIALRTCRPGHLTGSAFVIDPSRAAGLVLFHRKLQRWLQPGGHADGDTNLANVALREATEEVGIEDLRVVTPPIDIDIHEVDPPNEDAHLHLDVRFLVITPPGAQPVGNHESQGFRWITLDAMAETDFDPATIRMATSAFEVAARIGRLG